MGFAKADQVARAMGFARDAPEHVRAGVIHTLRARSKAGDVYVPRDELIESASQLLGVSASLVEDTISVPARRLTLDVQGFNREGELVWLSWSITVHWGNDGPLTPGDQDRYDGMFGLGRIVQDSLETAGYRVRMGRYALPNDCVPINGHFDCAEWYKDEQDRLRVRPVSTPPVPESTFKFDLADGSSTSPGNAPALPVEIRVSRSGVLVRVPATPDEVYSVAEVYLEHYDGQVVVRAWDQETMRVDYGGDPVAAVTLLADSADREMEANDD